MTSIINKEFDVLKELEKTVLQPCSIIWIRFYLIE